MNEREAAEHNAVAWLSLTDSELIERSASLGLPAELHPDPTSAPDAVAATRHDVEQLRAAADEAARLHAGGKFVNKWIRENRED